MPNGEEFRSACFNFVRSFSLSYSIFNFLVHAKCTSAERASLWHDLLEDKPSQGPWYVLGDFNLIVLASEKRRGRLFLPSKGLELLHFMNDSGLFDAGLFGQFFKWCNNRHGQARICKRLDRLLVTLDCLNMLEKISVSHLVRDPSDHAPFFISLSSKLDKIP